MLSDNLVLEVLFKSEQTRLKRKVAGIFRKQEVESASKHQMRKFTDKTVE